MTKKTLSTRATHAHGRVPRALRRTQVLAEAYALFIERGYAGTSMDELARRVGVTKPRIYDLVGSKEQLFRELMASVQEDLTTRLVTAVAGARDLAGRLHAGISAFLEFVRERQKGWVALLAMESAVGNRELVTLRGEQVARVAKLISESDDLEGAGVPLDLLAAIAQATNGAVEAAALWWLANPGLARERLATMLTQLLAPGLKALAQAPTVATKKRRARA